MGVTARSARVGGRNGPRLLAAGYDYLVVLAWMAVLFVVSLAIRAVTGAWPIDLAETGRIRAQALGFVTLDVPVLVYFVVCESSDTHATWGKRRVGLQVRSADGSAPTLARVAARTLVKFVPWEIAHLGVWTIVWSAQRDPAADPPLWSIVAVDVAMVLLVVWVVAVLTTGRGVHDRIAGTSVGPAS